MGFDRKEDFKSDFKEYYRSEEAPSIKESKADENSRRHGRAPKVETPHSRQVEKHGRAWTHGHPCVVARAAVRAGTAMLVPCPRGFTIIRLFIFFSLWVFLGDLLGFFWKHFIEIIRVLA